MQRRKFIKKVSWISLSTFSAGGIFSSCSKTELLKDVEFDGKVLIIGAGAAGLHAGYLLQSKNIDFEILEADVRYGGRLGRLDGFSDYPIDTGAQWLHGNKSDLGQLIESEKVKITLNDSEYTFWFQNQLIKSLPKDPFIFEKDNLPDVSFAEYAADEGFSNDYEFIIEGIAGDQGAAATRISAYWNYKEEEKWNSGDEDYKFEETFFDVIDQQYAKPILDKITTNWEVKSIDYQGDSILITDSRGNQKIADRLIITVPITILQKNLIAFSPQLPSDKINAFQKIGMDAGMKVFLKFQSKFYDDAIIGGAICAAYESDTPGKNSNEQVLLAFIMGTQAEKLSALGSDENITQALLQELDEMYQGQASQQFIASSIHDFSKNPFIQGAYSYSTVGMGNARSTAAESIDNRLFFAGEAMNLQGHHQTVHGALESGFTAVKDLLDSL
ncbi:MAG: flavin monoamine oxidase family protein [Saprospiraceae bacterium]